MSDRDFTKTLTIIFSSRCNLSCSFCCLGESLNKGNTITARDAFNFILWQVGLDPSISYTVEIFGGEPTIHYKDIKELWSMIEEYSLEAPEMLSKAFQNLSWRIYTNGVYSERIRADREFWSMFDDIIVSIEGEYLDSIDRHPNKHSYEVALSNYKDLLSYALVGIAFVIAEGTDIDRIFKYFESMGTRYFTFEIMTLINDDKSGEISLKYLYRVFKCIYENILVHNIEEPDNFYLFSIPRELLAGYNYFTNDKRYSCLDGMRSLSPSGDVYFCRDLAISEYHLKTISSKDSNVFFSTGAYKPFNIKDLQLQKDNDSFIDKARKYDRLTACPVKSFEFIHLTKDMSNPVWIQDKDFQDLLVRPMFELMWNTFSFYHSEFKNDENFYQQYADRIKLFGMTLEFFKSKYE